MNRETANLIKAGGRKMTGATPVNGTKVLKNQIVAARGEAVNIIENARAEAEAVRLAAEIDAENLRTEAWREGSAHALAEFEENLLESREIRDRIRRETEKDLLRLAVRLAEKIVGREIKSDKKTVIDIVSTALQNARGQEKLTVRVSPADLPTIEKEANRFSSGGRIRFIDFVADPRVANGGCLIESEVGTIDARLETQLRVLERALLSQSEGEGQID